MTIEEERSAGKGELGAEEFARVFEAARVMNLIFPQVVQGISVSMLGELLRSATPSQAIERFMRTPLPEAYARTYADHGNAAHTARGFVRTIDSSTAALLWEQEKRVALAILVRVFFTPEDKVSLGIDTTYIKDISNSLMKFLYVRDQDGGVHGGNEEGMRILSGFLSLRMREDHEGLEALRLYGPMFKEALNRLTKELDAYRNGFAEIVRKHRYEDGGRYNIEVNAHTEAMLVRALAEARVVLKEQELPRALKARIALFIDILEKQYSAF